VLETGYTGGFLRFRQKKQSQRPGDNYKQQHIQAGTLQVVLHLESSCSFTPSAVCETMISFCLANSFAGKEEKELETNKGGLKKE